MRLTRAAHERNAQAFDRMMAAFDRFEKRSEERDERAKQRDEQFGKRLEENELFMHELNRRSEKAFLKLFQDNREFLRALNVKIDAKTEALLAEMKEVREESRAQREAMLALIDRLPPAQQAA